MVALFCIALMAFCAFGIDMAFITLNRVKLQKAVETTALASVSRYKDTGADESAMLFNLFKSKFDTIQGAGLDSVEYKNEGGGVYKVKVCASLANATYFLRFIGVGGVKIEANSYAQTFEQVETGRKAGETIGLLNIMTDKVGDEFKVHVDDYNDGWFVFAGTKDGEGSYVWSDISCKSDVEVKNITVGEKTYGLICAKDATFDLTKSCNPAINTNIVSYLKFYNANPGECSNTMDQIKETLENELIKRRDDRQGSINYTWAKKFPIVYSPKVAIPYYKLVMPTIPVFPVTEDELKELIPKVNDAPFNITILNNVKLITGKDF